MAFVFNTPASMPTSHPYDRASEGLRGGAALVVFGSHVGIATAGGVTAPAWVVWPMEGLVAVLVFFVLSGYVIGLNYPQARPHNIPGYLLRRVVRLWPIYIIGLALAFAVAPPVAVRTMLAHLFFLENDLPTGFTVPVINTNLNLWTLPYEVLYYGLFAILWRFRISLVVVTGVTVLAMLGGRYTPWIPIYISSYATGFLFWLAGLALAWRGRTDDVEGGPWPTYLIVLIVTWKLRVLANILTFAPQPQLPLLMVRIYFLDVLPASLCLVAVISRRTLGRQPWIIGLSLLLPTVGIWNKWNNPGYLSVTEYRFLILAYLIALLLWRWRPSLRIFRQLAPLGAISYALYVTSRPIERFIFAHTPNAGPGVGRYVGAVVVTVAVSLSLAWILERRFQPWFKRQAFGI